MCFLSALDELGDVGQVVSGAVRREPDARQKFRNLVAGDPQQRGGFLGRDELRGHLERVRLWPCWDTLFAKKRRSAVRTKCETGTQSRPEIFISASNIDEEMRALIEVVSSFMWGTMGHNGVWGQVPIVIFFDFFLGRLERGTKEHMSSNLDIELKVRISEAMSRQIDTVVASRPEGVNRSDIVREAIAGLLTNQLHESGKDDLRKAASRIKRSLGK